MPLLFYSKDQKKYKVNFLFYYSKRISGKLCLITGAGSGIGRLLSFRFAKLGCKLVLLDINGAALEKVAKEVKDLVGTAPATYVCDVSDKEKVKKLVEDVKRDVGEVIIHFAS